MSDNKYIIEAVDLFKYQWRSFLMSVGVLLTFYILSLLVKPGLITGLIVLPACAIVLLTCIARLNDMGPERNHWTDHARRIGLTLLGASVVLVAASVFAPPYVLPWRGVLLLWGLALVFLTTPSLPPWPYYITGKYREAEGLYDHVGLFTGAHSRKTGQLSVKELDAALELSESDKKRRQGDGDGP